ncbi:UL36 very large tegument protein [Streptomyces sp. NPDC006339]|uniref:UL36 very large tegument protein n=1 Tax=Streptomyces sp. NPDC006339 TaxID=3156755 RepID=UPI00339DBE55
MAVRQLPAEVAAFTGWLSELAGRLTPGEGWYGVFSVRDPDGLRACFAGTDVLPWDVVESLLQDLAEPLDGPRALRGRALHEAAATAHDRAAPGGAAALAERRDLMRREARHAEARIHERTARPAPDDTTLAWAHDDLRRAHARIAELTARLRRLERETVAEALPAGPQRRHPDAATAGVGGGSVPTGRAGASTPTPSAGTATSAAPAAPAPAPAPPAASVRRRPRGARYAGLEEVDPSTAVAVPVPELPTAPAGAPRGARFGGVPGPALRPAPAADDGGEAARAAGNAVYALRRLRAQGRSGEAHALLCEALAGPPAWLPVLAAELHGAGLAADWATLLWEAATLPPARLAAVAGALADAGRPQDCDQLLRQGVARPVEELAGACAALYAEARHAEAHALLTAFVRSRTPEDAARLAAAGPAGGKAAALTAGLLAAARSVSPSRERDVLHALRVARLA